MGEGGGSMVIGGAIEGAEGGVELSDSRVDFGKDV